MSNDYLKRQPSKSEKMIYDLFMHQQDLARSLWTTTSFVTALAYLLKIEPEKVAQALANDHEKIKDYSDKVNAEIQKLEAAKKTDAGKEASK